MYILCALKYTLSEKLLLKLMLALNRFDLDVYLFVYLNVFIYLSLLGEKCLLGFQKFIFLFCFCIKSYFYVDVPYLVFFLLCNTHSVNFY